MKKIFLIAAMFISVASFSQDVLKPAIKQGTKFKYLAHVEAQDIPMVLSVDSLAPNYLKLGWEIDGYGAGAWIMNAKSLESATAGYWGNPSPGVDEKVPDDMHVLVLSKALWNSISKDKKMDYEQMTFTVKEATDAQKLKINGKAVDAVYLESGTGTKLWILNDASFPIMLKIEGNTKGPDLIVSDLM